MKTLRRHPYLFALVFLAATALAFQTVRSLAKPSGADTQPLAALTPPGALLSIESPDFAALLNSWNSSPEQRAWLASANYSVFSNSRLFGRLNDAETQFAAASQIPAAKLLPQVAGKQSLFAWYDISNLEFLYITRMSPAQAQQTDLLKSRGKWQQRSAGGITFYMRTSGNGSDTPKRTVAFASTNDLFFVATREDLLANALQLLSASKSEGAAQNSLAAEPWFTAASATLKPGPGAPPILHMVLDLQRIVPMAQFRTYWVQQNITEFKQYRSAVADLYRDPSAFHEERSILLMPSTAATADPTTPADPDLAPLAALAPTTGVSRAMATTVPTDAITAIQEKLLGSPVTSATSVDAPDPSLTPAQAGDATDLDTRIDTPAPVSTAASNQALTAALEAAGFDALLTYSSAQATAQTSLGQASLWLPIHSAVVLHATGAWKPDAVAQALQQSLRGALTTSTLGIDFHPATAGGRTVYALTGPKPLFFAIAGSYLLLADDQPLLTSMLAAPPAAPAPMHATLIAGFNHSAQRAPFARLTSLIDGTNKTAAQPDSAPPVRTTGDVPPPPPIPAPPDPAAPPAFFSGNIRSLSDAFAALESEHLTERHATSSSGAILRQTVTYQWQQ